LKARGYDLDGDQIASGIVGGGNDGGVDSFYVFANAKLIREDADLQSYKDQQLAFDVVVIQSKTTPSFGERPLTALKDFTENCLRFGSDLSTVSRSLYSPRLLDAVSLFHDLYRQTLLKRPTLKVGFYYSSFGEQINNKVKTRARLLREATTQYFTGCDCTVTLAGASELLARFYDTPVSTVTLETSRSFYSGALGKAYVCLASLENFAKFITNRDSLRSYMFEANVRDYQGDVTVNKEIALTLSSPGAEEFWWLNNGVTILATEAHLDGDSMSITQPLIVNGLQTSHEVFNYSRLGGFSNDTRTILVRVIEATDAASIDNIIKATNSQTTIPRIWLHATEPLHRRIESVLRASDLYYDRRKNFHRNQGVAAGKIITIPYLAQSLAAIVLQKPDDARARPTTVADKHYRKLFAEEFPVDVYAKCALIMKRTTEFLDSLLWARSDKLNVQFYLAMYVACMVTRSPMPRRDTIARIDVSRLDDALMQAALTQVQSAFLEYGGDDKAAKGSALTARLQQELQERFGRKKRSTI
jgi:hypothetical protein